MRREALAALAAVLLASMLIIGYAGGVSNRQTLTETSAVTSTMTATSFATTETSLAAATETSLETSYLTTTSPVTTTSSVTETATSLITETFTISSTSTATVTATAGVPWNSTWFLNNDPGCSGPGGYSPCWGGNLSIAVVFSCGTAPASQAGCTSVVNSSAPAHPGYTITIWFPKIDQANEPSWANCEFSVPIDDFFNSPAYCISLSTISFIVALQAPGPV